MHENIDDIRTKKKRNLIRLPHDLRDVGGYYKWPTVEEPEEIIFDLRSKEEIKASIEGKNVTSFNHEFNLWQERPVVLY